MGDLPRLVGRPDCRHATTKGAIICEDCGVNVTTYPWQIQQAQNDGYRQGLNVQVTRGIRIFQLGIVLGIITTLFTIFCVAWIFS